MARRGGGVKITNFLANKLIAMIRHESYILTTNALKSVTASDCMDIVGRRIRKQFLFLYISFVSCHEIHGSMTVKQENL